MIETALVIALLATIFLLIPAAIITLTIVVIVKVSRSSNATVKSRREKALASARFAADVHALLRQR